MKKIIAIDVDEVLRDFVKSLYLQLKKVFKIVYMVKYNQKYNIDSIFPDFSLNFLVYFFSVIYPKQVFLNANPFPNAVKFMKWLNDQNVYIKIITSQLNESTKFYTIEWLKKYNIKYNEIIFTEEKHKIDFDLIIDDNPNVIKKLKQENKNYIIMDRQWNKYCEGERAKNFLDCKNYIKKYL